MSWKIVCQIGNNDNFYPAIESEVPRLLMTIDKDAGTFPIRNSVFEDINSAGLRLPEIVVDLVYLALAVFSADVRVPRSSARDRWTREMEVYLPVSDPQRWENVTPTVCRMLSFLTGDQWDFHFRQRDPKSWEEAPPAQKEFQAVCLFSGGLDSFIGAIDLLEEKQKLALVGQYGRGSTKKEKDRSCSVFPDQYSSQITPFWFYVQPYKGKGRNSENTMRARSILFLALGTAIASTIKNDAKLYVPENGLISLNVPLTYSRTGSLSTRTTHPHFIALYQELLNQMGIEVTVEMPYRFKTKGEMVREAKNLSVLKQGAGLTMSCAHPFAGRYQKLPVGKHCGYCVPCLIRRAALRLAGLDSISDYNYDIITDCPSSEAAAGRDRRAFEMAIERTQKMSRLQLLAEVLNSGPVAPEEIENYVNVYQQGLKEVAAFLYDRPIQ